MIQAAAVTVFCVGANVMQHTPLCVFVGLLPKQWHLIWLAHKSPGLIILLSAGPQRCELTAFDASVSGRTAAAELPNPATDLSAQI